MTAHFEGGRGSKSISFLEEEGPYDAVVVTAKHDQFVKEISLSRLKTVLDHGAPLIDLRGLFDEKQASLCYDYWTA